MYHHARPPLLQPPDGGMVDQQRQQQPAPALPPELQQAQALTPLPELQLPPPLVREHHHHHHHHDEGMTAIDALLREARAEYRAGRFHQALALGEQIRKTLDPQHVGTLLLLSAACFRLRAYLPWCVRTGALVDCDACGPERQY